MIETTLNDPRARLQQALTVPAWSEDPDVACAGRMLNLGRSATYRAIHDGSLPTLKVGGRYVVSTRVLLRYIDGEQASA